MSEEIYYEQQIGSLCRLHAINAFFGRHMITQELFFEYIREYDEFNRSLDPSYSINSTHFDCCHFYRETLISFILKKYGIYTIYIPISRCTPDLSNLLGKFIFAFNENHIYGMRYHNNRWYKVDSISPHITPCVATCYNTGMIIPVSPYKEIRTAISNIKNIIKSYGSPYECVVDIHRKRKDLGNIDEQLATMMSIIRFQSGASSYPNILDKSNKYSRFIRDYKNNYPNIDKKIELILPILEWVNKLKT